MNYITKYLLKIFIILSLFSSLSLANATEQKGQLPAYEIGPGDVLEIAVWKEDGLQKEVLVRPDGAITFPLADEIQAGGMTIKVLQQALVNKIKRFIPEPVVNVSVLKINNNKVYVVGKVGRPGEFVASQYVDVMQALAMAGGLNAYASSNDIKILRRVGGKEISLPFEYDVVAQGKELSQNIILKSGDVVVVP